MTSTHMTGVPAAAPQIREDQERTSRMHPAFSATLVNHGVIRRDQIAAIVRLTPMSMASNMVCSAVFALVTWRQFPPETLAAWLGAVWGMSALMLYSWYRRRNAPPATASTAAIRRVVRYSFLLALPWAALPAFMFRSAEMDVQLLIAAVATGMACTGGFALSAVPAAALVYTATILTPILVQCFTLATPHYVALAALTLIYGSTFAASILSHGRLTRARAIDAQAMEHQNQFIGLLLRDFEENASDWLWETDGAGRLSYCSERLPQLLGRDRWTLIGTPLAALANGEQRNEGWQKLHERMETRQPFHDITVPVRIDDEVCWWSLTARPVFGEEGRYLGYRGVGTDVSAARKAEELRLAKEEAERAHVAKSRFLAMMSHELKTPLNAIIGFSDLIAGQKLGTIAEARYIEYAQDINENSKHLLAIINDVLQMARAENGLIRIDEEKFAARHLVETILRLLAPAAAASRVTLGLAPRVPDIVLTGDYRLLKQVLVNLVSNAIKFTPEGGTVTVGFSLDKDTRLVIYVEDTGIGVASGDMERIFEPFRQLDDQLGRRKGGLGLGLSIARQFARAHGGDIAFRSEQGKGSTAALILPQTRISFWSDAA